MTFAARAAGSCQWGARRGDRDGVNRHAREESANRLPKCADVEGLTRRQVLLGAGAGALGLTGVVPLLRSAAAAADAYARTADLPVGLPTDAVHRTMQAYADTIVPGPAGGADPHPGAVEAGCVAEIYDSFYGLADSYPLMHADLQAATPRVLGEPARFDLSLRYPQREAVVRDRISAPPDGGTNPLYLLYFAVAVLVEMTWLGTARSDLGPRYLGFPTHSDGYLPHHSYYVTFTGMTSDGNPR